MDYDEPTARRFMTAATYADRYRASNHRRAHYDDYGPEENDWESQREHEGIPDFTEGVAGHYIVQLPGGKWEVHSPEGELLHTVGSRPEASALSVHYETHRKGRLAGFGDALEPGEHFDNRDPALGHTYPNMVGGPPPGGVAIQPPGHGGPDDARIIYDKDTGLGYDAIARPAPHGGGWDVLKELPDFKAKHPELRKGSWGKVAAPQRGAHWQPVVDALREIGGRYRENPVTLKDGRQTNIYLDAKNVFASGRHMNNLSQAMLEHAQSLGIDYNAVGGPTMGADVISHGMVAHHPNPDMGWFTVRDQPKSDHGLGKWIEGTELGPNHKVIITDDVADTGKSLVDAYHKVRESGAQVAAVMPVVERGDKTRAQFEQLGVPYHPLCNYQDLGIQTLSNQEPPPAAPSRVEEHHPGPGPMYGYPGAPIPND